MLFALGYGGAASTAAADNIVTDGRTDTTLENAGDGSLSIETETVRDGVGFNSFSRFRLDSGRTVNLHHHANTEHLVNLVHDERIEITDGTVNSLVDGQVGGHLVFADPHGMIVGADGVINAGQLTLTTPSEGFMDELASEIDGSGALAGDSAVRSLVDGEIAPEDIASDRDALIEINGSINTTGGVRIHAGRVHVGADAAVEAGTQDAVSNIGDAVNVDDVATGVAAEVTDGRIEIVAETEESIADGRTGEPLDDESAPPADDEFAVAVSGRLAANRSDEDAETEATGIHIEGRDVRITGSVESLDDGGPVHRGGRVTVRTTDDPDADHSASRADNVEISGRVAAHDVEIEGRRIELDGEVTAAAPAAVSPSLTGELRIVAAQDVVSGGSADSELDADSGIVVDAGGDIGSASGALALRGETLWAEAGGGVHLGFTGDIDIPNLEAGGDLHLQGTDDVTYGRIVAADTLELTGFSSVRGDGGLRMDGGGDSLLQSGEDLGITADTIAAATDFTGMTRVESDDAIDLQAETIELDEVDTGAALDVEARRFAALGSVVSVDGQDYTDGAADAGSLRWSDLDAGGAVTIDVGGDVVGTSMTGGEGFTVEGATIDVDSVDTGGTQAYTGDHLLYNRLEAGSWTGGEWGTGSVDRHAEIHADVDGVIVPTAGTESHARATAGSPNLTTPQGIVKDDRAGTAISVEGDVTAITTTTTSSNGEIGFNSFHHFQVAAEKTANLYLPDGAQHLVNVVRDSAVSVHGTVNALSGGEIGGHLVFADPHGMLVGRQGTINAGRLSLTMPDATFLSGLEDINGEIAADAAAGDALVNGTVDADSFGDNTLNWIDGGINTVGAARLRSDRIRIGPDGAIEAGTKTARDELLDTGFGVKRDATNGRIVVAAETLDSIADDREGNPLDDLTTPASDSAFAVAVNGRLAVARSDTGPDVDPADTRIDISGTDVRVGSSAKLDAQGMATFDAGGAVTDPGEYIGGQVRIRGLTRHEPGDVLWSPVNPVIRDASLDLAGEIAAFSVDADGRYIDVGGSIRAARRSDLAASSVPASADGAISLSAVSEQYTMWGVVESESGIRVDGTLDGHDLLLSAYSRATAGIGPANEEIDLPRDDKLNEHREELHGQVSGLSGELPFGVALVADADATVDIGADAELRATGEMDISSVARRESKTDRLLGGVVYRRLHGPGRAARRYPGPRRRWRASVRR